jgi:hypothetical protein
MDVLRIEGLSTERDSRRRRHRGVRATRVAVLSPEVVTQSFAW